MTQEQMAIRALSELHLDQPVDDRALTSSPVVYHEARLGETQTQPESEGKRGRTVTGRVKASDFREEYYPGTGEHRLIYEPTQPGLVGAPAGGFPKHADDCEAMQWPRADCTCVPTQPEPEDALVEVLDGLEWCNPEKLAADLRSALAVRGGRVVFDKVGG